MNYKFCLINEILKLSESECDLMSAGESANMSLDDIAKKHNVSIDLIKQQLEMGIKVEQEHTTSLKIAEKIAMDHLTEDPHYYSKLKKMENE